MVASPIIGGLVKRLNGVDFPEKLAKFDLVLIQLRVSPVV